MTNPLYRPFEAIQERQKTVARHAENSARLAHSFGEYTTTGWGEFEPEDPIMFDAPHIERPTPMYAASLDDEDQSEDIVATRFPRSGITVTKWHRTNTGLYTGASVAIWVEDRSPFMATADPDPEIDYVLIHHITFLGIATKDILSPTKGKDMGAK